MLYPAVGRSGRYISLIKSVSTMEEAKIERMSTNGASPLAAYTYRD